MLNAVPPDLNFLAPTVVDDLIRVGGSYDGGYVVPYSAIQRAGALLSFGVNTDWSFEKDFHAINRLAVIHTYDHTVSKRRFRRAALKGVIKSLLGGLSRDELLKRFKLWREFSSFFGSWAQHFEQKIVGGTRNDGEATLKEVFDRCTAARIFLKIDIEGDEYAIIEDIAHYSDRIEALVMEFHDTRRRELFCQAVKRLQSKFEIVHLHGNNYAPVAPDGFPQVVEMTFIPRSSEVRRIKRSELPLEHLDNPNNADRADYSLRFKV